MTKKPMFPKLLDSKKTVHCLISVSLGATSFLPFFMIVPLSYTLFAKVFSQEQFEMHRLSGSTQKSGFWTISEEKIEEGLKRWLSRVNSSSEYI